MTSAQRSASAQQSASASDGVGVARRSGRVMLGLAVAGLALVAATHPVAADWRGFLGRFAELSGFATPSGSGTRGTRALEAAASHLKALPAEQRDIALAAHVNAEGHWSFVNASGEHFTAGTPDEMKRVVGVLAPKAAAGMGASAGPAYGKLTVILSEDTVFGNRAALAQLPANARLLIGFADEAYALARLGDGPAQRLFAEVRPNLLIEIGERQLFDEAAWQLARPLARAQVRVLALEPGGPASLAPTPRFDAESKRAQIDQIDPVHLNSALRAIGGQTAILSGRLDGDALWFQPASGAGRSLPFGALVAAAQAADVNLIVLRSATARQPGARNWLWQRVSVDGLDTALQRDHLSDFLEALGLEQTRLLVSAGDPGRVDSKAGDPVVGMPPASGRVLLRAVPLKADGATLGGLSDLITDMVADASGKVVASGMEANLIAADRQRELDARLMPGIPSGVQWLYLGCLALGLVGLVPARRWWSRIWPAERADGYDGKLGFWAARLVRALVFGLLFLPAVALAACPLALLGRAWRGRRRVAPTSA